MALEQKSEKLATFRGAGAPPVVRILGQYTKDVSFESPAASSWVRNPTNDAKVTIDIDVDARQIDPDIYEVSIDFIGRAARKGGVIYNIEITYAGTFEIKNFAPDVLEPVLFINCPSILFPFLRNLVGSMALAGGFPPLWLDPVDWSALFTQRIEERRQQATKANGRVAPANGALAHA